MMMKTHKIKTSILHQLAFAAMVTVVMPATAQTLLEENFSTGLVRWTVVHRPENSNVRAPDLAGMLINDAKTSEN